MEEFREQEQQAKIKLPKKYEELAKSMAHFGYGWEAFSVTTKDGYELTLFRITGPLKDNIK